MRIAKYPFLSQMIFNQNYERASELSSDTLGERIERWIHLVNIFNLLQHNGDDVTVITTTGVMPLLQIVGWEISAEIANCHFLNFPNKKAVFLTLSEHVKLCNTLDTRVVPVACTCNLR